MTQRSFLAAGAVAIGGYYLIPVVGLGSGSQDVAFTAVSMAATAAVFLGIARHQPAGKMPWLLLGAAQASYTIADVIYSITFGLSGGEPGFPGVADVFFVLQYPFLITALVVFIQRRTPQWHAAAFIDAAILATGFTLVWWIYLLGPTVAGTGESGAGGALAIFYSTMDLLVLALGMQLVIGVGAQTTSFRLLVGSLALVLIADVAFATQEAGAGYVDGGWVDSLWMGSYLLLGAAALHESMRWLDRRAIAWPTLSYPRLGGLAFAVALPLAAAGSQYLRGSRIDIPVVIGGTALLLALIMIRLTWWATAQRQLAIVDGLTGLHAREFWSEWLRLQCDRARQRDVGLGVLIADLDNFGMVNSRYGRAGGDRALHEVARRIRTACAAGDLAARYREDEFLIVLPDSDWSHIRQVAERIQEAVSSARIPVNDQVGVRLTVSIGVATLPADGSFPAVLTRTAERALDAAKRAGRNRVFGRTDTVEAGWQARRLPAGQHSTSH